MMRCYGDRKGITSVIGTLFFLSILVLSIAFLLYVMTHIGIYNLSVIEMNRFDWEKIQERLAIKTLWINISSRYSRINMTIENQGTIPLEVDQLWIINRTDNIHKVFQFNPAIYLKPQEEKTGVGIDYTIDTTKNYTFILVTRRGNKAYIHYTLREYIHKEILPHIHFTVFSPDQPPPDKIILGKDPFHIYVTQRSNLRGVTAIIIGASIKFYNSETGENITSAFILEDSTLNYGYVTLREGYGTPMSFRYRFDKNIIQGKELIWVDVNVTLTININNIIVQVDEYSARTLVVGGRDLKILYVYEITFKERGNSLYARVKIVDIDGKGVPGAKVTITVSGGGGMEETTRGDGYAEFKLPSQGMICVEVKNVEKEDWKYMPDLNLETYDCFEQG